MARALDRRRFLASSAAAIAAPAMIPSSVFGQGRPAPSERINLAVIGLGGNGSGTLTNFLGKKEVQVVAVCDVHDQHYRDNTSGRTYGREPGRQAVEKRYAEDMASGTYKGCDAYADFREVCARDDIDAVVVATPDHWHALITLAALRNGKDVYCEKPVTHLFGEGQAVYREVESQKAVFQTGSQQRSEIRFRIAVEVALNELIGKIHTVEVGLPPGHSKPQTELVDPTDPPAGLDYDLWCGPSEALPYIHARHHRNWRWHLSYGGGQIMDWIGHHNDIAHWGLGMDESGPEKVEAIGWTYPDTEIYNAPVDYEIRSTFANGVTSTISSKNQRGTKWIGDNGWVYVDRGKIECSNREWLQEKYDRGAIKTYESNDHRQNFLDCIRSREACIAPAETAHRSVTPGHLGYVSQALGRPVKWDPATENVIDDDEADKLLKAVNYRDGWSLA
ncbi:MAG: Gfo/Idh/MocA family oxidoreductase [Verrucomicrobiales bacterium]|nr:Gfo/Idh/MocA family oxidoreductase [Verrucomicrobiales bacterium]